jgi:hypothetical protein
MAGQTCRLAAAGLAAITALLAQLPMEPAHTAGQSITGAFEGWFRNADGSATIMCGYFNRNLTQRLEIPVGADNRIEPGGPDRGQPTRFLPGRQWAVFTIHVPKDFAPDSKLTWTLRANGKTTVIPLKLDPLWLLSPYRDASNNTPPFISFELGKTGAQGPPLEIAKSYEAAVGKPVELRVWVADDAQTGMNPTALQRATPPVALKWITFRGPADADFSPTRPPIEKIDPPPGLKFAGTSKTNATFSIPGEYVIEVIATDWSGEGGSGFQCCWSTAQVRVLVK